MELRLTMAKTSGMLCCITVMVVAACASGGGGVAAGEVGGCTLRTADSLFVGVVPVFRECAVDRKARLTSPAVTLDYPQPMDGCHRAVIEFVVGLDGLAEVATARVVETNSERLAVALLESLPYRRYDPAQIDGLPVRQIVREERLVGPRRFTVQRSTGGIGAPGAGASAGPSRPLGC